LTITTSAQSGAALARHLTMPPWSVVLALVGLAALTRTRSPRRRSAGLHLLLLHPRWLVTVAGVCLACGGSSSSQPPQSTGSVTVAPTSLAFGTRSVGVTSAPQTVTLSNTGTTAVTLASIAVAGDFQQTNSCGTTLAVNAACSIQVTFKPSAIGARTGSLTISDNAVGSPQVVGLSGTGDNGVTPPGSYPISVTGAAGTLVQSGTVTLVVQ
jgi:hypothetical protein